MRPVSDAFLLEVAEISATLIGLFLVGFFFFVETGFGGFDDRARDLIQPYFKAGARIILLLYATSLFLSLTLVVLGPVWNRVLFLLLSLLLVAANVSTLIHFRPLAGATRSYIWAGNELVGTIAVLAVVLVPWVLGGFHPSREDLTWAVLLSFAMGFVSMCALVLSVFDTARAET
jgi:hypothetical protein